MTHPDRCLHCGVEFDPVYFPLARPRKDGSRGHYHYCEACLALRATTGQLLRGGGREAKNRAARDLRRRQTYARWAS